MKSIFIIPLSLLLSFGARAQNTVSNESFSKIRIKGTGKVLLRQDSVCSVSEGAGILPSTGEIAVKNGVLVLNGNSGNDINVALPVLEEIYIDGHGSVTGQTTIETENVRLDIRGDGKINLDVVAKKVEAEIAGIGKIVLSGRTQDADFSIPGSGKIDASAMKTIRCNAAISGVGKCTVDVVDELNANISGNGNIVYMKAPKNMSTNVTGVGNVRGNDSSEEEINMNPDTTRLNVGSSQVWIISKKDSTRTKKHKAKPIWAGFELGINSYLDNGGSFTLSPGKENFDLRTEKSVSAALNLIQENVELGKSNIWLFTGLGITWNNYRFENNVYLENGPVIKALVDTTPNVRYLKSKLTTSYLTAPLMFEFFTSRNIKKAFHFGAGGIFGFRIGSHTKRKLEIDGDVTKIKDHDDYNLNPFRYGFRVAAGYGKFNIFADYYASTLFRNNKGPVLYPVNAGITLAGF
jgi:hypothetical protein